MNSIKQSLQVITSHAKYIYYEMSYGNVALGDYFLVLLFIVVLHVQSELCFIYLLLLFCMHTCCTHNCCYKIHSFIHIMSYIYEHIQWRWFICMIRGVEVGRITDAVSSGGWDGRGRGSTIQVVGFCGRVL